MMDEEERVTILVESKTRYHIHHMYRSTVECIDDIVDYWIINELNEDELAELIMKSPMVWANIHMTNRTERLERLHRVVHLL